MAYESFKPTVPRLAVVVCSVAGVHSDVMYIPHGRRKWWLDTAHYAGVGDALLHTVDIGLVKILHDSNGGVWYCST